MVSGWATWRISTSLQYLLAIALATGATMSGTIWAVTWSNSWPAMRTFTYGLVVFFWMRSVARPPSRT